VIILVKIQIFLKLDIGVELVEGKVKYINKLREHVQMKMVKVYMNGQK
jgi:hypothetical protein